MHDPFKNLSNRLPGQEADRPKFRTYSFPGTAEKCQVQTTYAKTDESDLQGFLHWSSKNALGLPCSLEDSLN